MDLVLRLCARLVVVGDGGIIADGPTRALLSNESLLARAGLRPPSIMPAVRWLERSPRC
jgi:energy-coupling factor transport system ATP-binding protein